MNKLSFFIFLFFIFVNGAFAFTAQSSSYSVSMFGNGMTTGRGYSNSYNSTFLSETGGTTRNAESLSFKGNIGFFEESAYLRTVSIGSYSISPRTAVVGSTIGLSVTALNAQSIWAQITSPNSQVQILNLINGQTLNYLPSPSVVGRYNLIFYANDSNGAIASVVDFFDLTEQSSNTGGTSGGSGSSGGGNTRVVERCNYNWDCTPWSVCSEGIQSRSCVNIGTCIGNNSKPIEQMKCSEALFDIALKLDNLKFTESGSINFNVNLDEKIGLGKIDVHIKYAIIDSGGYELFSQIETKAVEKSLSYDKNLNGFNLIDGWYILRVDILYGNLQRAFAEQKFSIIEGELNKDNGGITGSVVATDIILKRLKFSVILFIASIILLIGAYWYFAKGPFKNKIGLLSYVRGLEVYTDNGMKIGRVYEVMIEGNRIYGLMVVVDSKAPIKWPKVMIRYEFVQSIHDVVVVNSRILESNSREVSA